MRAAIKATGSSLFVKIIALLLLAKSPSATSTHWVQQKAFLLSGVNGPQVRISVILAGELMKKGLRKKFTSEAQ
jgi:hypothetical protein